MQLYIPKFKISENVVFCLDFKSSMRKFEL